VGDLERLIGSIASICAGSIGILRTEATDEKEGFMKVLISALVFTMIGPEAGEVMAAVQTAMLAGSPY
jgi:hypothetical protein